MCHGDCLNNEKQQTSTIIMLFLTINPMSPSGYAWESLKRMWESLSTYEGVGFLRFGGSWDMGYVFLKFYYF